MPPQIKKIIRDVMNKGMSSADKPRLLPLWKARVYHRASFEILSHLGTGLKDRVLDGNVLRSTKHFSYVRLQTHHSSFVILARTLPVVFEVPEYLSGEYLTRYLEHYTKDMSKALSDAKRGTKA